jgi:phospholipid/cholesterol/gamma-HCH transport system substrate-binding protein
MKKQNAVLLGLFITLGAVIVVAAVFLVGGREGIFTTSYPLYARFNSVEGLKKGAAVRLLGIDVGTVTDIRISNRIALVNMKIFADSRKFIKQDSRAMIETEGLVGNKYVILTPGSDEAKTVQPGDTLNSIESPQLSQIILETRQTIASVKKMVDEFTGILGEVRTGKGTIGKLLTDEGVYLALKRATYEADSSLRKVSDKFSEMSNIISNFAGSLNGLVSKTDSILTGVDFVVQNFDTTSLTVKHVVAQLDTGRGLVSTLLHDRAVYDTSLKVVTSTLAAVREAQTGLRRFSENMEALRHNWLFSSYFAGQAEDEYTKKQRQLKEIDAQIQERAELLEKMEKQLKELQQKFNKAGG